MKNIKVGVLTLLYTGGSVNIHRWQQCSCCRQWW